MDSNVDSSNLLPFPAIDSVTAKSQSQKRDGHQHLK